MSALAQKDAGWVRYVERQIRRGHFSLLFAQENDRAIGYVLTSKRTLGTGTAAQPRHFWNWGRIGYRHSLAQPDALLAPQCLGDIREVFVAHHKRKQGLGAALIRAGVSRLQDQGIEEIQASLPPDNAGIHRTFQAAGFAPAQVVVYRRQPDSRWNKTMPSQSRCATEYDALELATLYCSHIAHQVALAPHLELADDIDWMAHLRAKFHHPAVQLLVIKKAGHIVAFAELWRHNYNKNGTVRILNAMGQRFRQARSPHHDSRGVVQEIYVRPEYRQRGLASILLRESHGWFGTQGIRHTQASIWQDNTSSLCLFHKCGYTTCSTSWRYTHEL